MISFDLTKKYLVAVSGGPDSIFLINYLIKNFNSKNFIVACVNYNFRSDSYIDENIVRNFCEKNKIKYFILQLSWDEKQNFESWARNERYKWFSELVKINKLYGVITAHNKNDLIETYILQKQREIIPDFFGLKFEQILFGVKILRPLIDTCKSEILQYLNVNNISYAIDSTNLDTRYKRNSIRKKLKEEEFEKIFEEINIENRKLNSIKKEALALFKNSFKNNILNVKDFLLKKSEIFIKYFIYIFFVRTKNFDLIKNSKHSLINEIYKRLLFSHKKYWEINVKNKNIIFDFENLSISNKPLFWNRISTSNIEKLKFDKNYLIYKDKIKNISKYLISNDYFYYKDFVIVGSKKISKWFNNKKVSYETRSKVLAIIDLNSNQLLNHNFFIM